MAFADFVKTVKNETGDAIEITKLKAKISKEKTNVKDCYEKIGELVYREYARTHVADESLMEYMTKIDASREQIRIYNDEISKVKMSDK